MTKYKYNTFRNPAALQKSFYELVNNGCVGRAYIFGSPAGILVNKETKSKKGSRKREKTNKATRTGDITSQTPLRPSDNFFVYNNKEKDTHLYKDKDRQFEKI